MLGRHVCGLCVTHSVRDGRDRARRTVTRHSEPPGPLPSHLCGKEAMRARPSRIAWARVRVCKACTME